MSARVELDPRSEGMHALDCNRARRSNPYREGSEARAEWDGGYCDAMRSRYGVLTREEAGLPARKSPPKFERVYR